MRGGRKGGLLVCERNVWLASAGINSTETIGNTRFAERGTEKFKKLTAQFAIDAQFTIDLSHGAVSGGQQSDMFIDPDVWSEGAISVDVDISCELAPNALPATGSIATERATRAADMVRPMFMNALSALQYPAGVLIGQVTILREWLLLQQLRFPGHLIFDGAP